MLITFFRAIVLYIVVLIVMRLMGKREIGQLQPFELAISIMIADLASIPMSETGIPISNGILETSGQVTVIPKPNKRPTTPEDFNMEPKYEGIPYDLVVDGRVMYKNLEKLGKNYVWLERQTRKFGIKPEEALIVTIDGDDNFYCQPIDKVEK